MTLKTLIVDDEPLARQRLRLFLSDERDVDVIGECRNGHEAVAALRSQAVDLLFLDVEMPGLSGLDVAAEIGELHLPPTIFVTAYQQHAIQAFEIAAVDYVSKPFERERLSKAVQRVRLIRAAAAAASMQDYLATLLARLEGATAVPPPASRRFLVKEGDRDLIILADEVEWIEADNYYARLHVRGKSYMLRESMAQLTRHLDRQTFVRVHRSAIVNLDHVKALFRDGVGEGQLQMRNDERVKTSKVGRQKLAALLALT